MSCQRLQTFSRLQGYGYPTEKTESSLKVPVQLPLCAPFSREETSFVAKWRYLNLRPANCTRF